MSALQKAIMVLVAILLLLFGPFLIDYYTHADAKECSVGSHQHFKEVVAPAYGAEYWREVEPSKAFERAAIIESKVVYGMGFTQGIPDEYTIHAYKTADRPGYIMALAITPDNCIAEIVPISEVYWATKIDE